MAVRIQFTTLLIRIDRLLAVALDGVAAITARWSPSWRDEHLLAVAFMDMGARDLAAELEGMGLVLRDTSTGQRVWQDIAVVDYYDGPTLPCAWLECDVAQHVAWLAGTVPGPVAGPDHEHEEAPVRVSPDKFQQLLQSQHPHLFAPAPAPAKPAREGRTRPGEHEAVLLPLTQQIAAELLHIIPLSAKIDTVVFMAHFPGPGEVVKAGVVLHEIDGELRSMTLPPLTSETRRLLEQLSRYDSGNRLTSIEIKIASDGRVTTEFGIAPPKSPEELEDLLRRRFGSVPTAKAPRAPAPTGFFGKLKAMFGAGPRVTLHPQPSLRHTPPREPSPCSWTRCTASRRAGTTSHRRPRAQPPTPRPPRARPVAPPPSTSPRFTASRPGESPAPRPQARRLHPDRPAARRPRAGRPAGRRGPRLPPPLLAEFHRERPDLRFDAGDERLVRDLGPLGELHFTAWNGNLNRADLYVKDLPSLDDLLARLQPVLAALGGLGPVTCALGSRTPPASPTPSPSPTTSCAATSSPTRRSAPRCTRAGCSAPRPTPRSASTSAAASRTTAPPSATSSPSPTSEHYDMSPRACPFMHVFRNMPDRACPPRHLLRTRRRPPGATEPRPTASGSPPATARPVAATSDPASSRLSAGDELASSTGTRSTHRARSAPARPPSRASARDTCTPARTLAAASLPSRRLPASPQHRPHPRASLRGLAAASPASPASPRRREPRAPLAPFAPFPRLDPDRRAR
ncbi:hypothetical protein [Nannocystis pusilla]|uniref:hypothetical protein n=1 Tax=Nannocystis pusilla TaxID=889268 RepID=UPI003B7B1EFD